MAAHDRPPGHKLCLDHLTEELTFICKTCGIPICNKCLPAKHKTHDFDNIGTHADLKYNELLNFKSEATDSTIPKIEQEVKTSDQDFDDVEKLIKKNIKTCRDNGETLRDMIAVHMSDTEREYKKRLEGYKKDYNQYKSKSDDTTKTFLKLLKKTEDAITSKGNVLLVDVANDVAMRKPSFTRYQQLKVNVFVPGSEPEKSIRKAFGHIQESEPDSSAQVIKENLPNKGEIKSPLTKTILPKFDVNQVASLPNDPRSIVRRKYGTLYICYLGSRKLTKVPETGSPSDVQCDVKLWGISIHPTTDQMYCIPYSGEDVLSLNSDTGKTMKLFGIKENAYCIAVTQQDHVIVGECSIKFINVYDMNGKKLHTIVCEGKPEHVAVCRSTGKVDIAFSHGKGCFVFDDKYKKLYTTTLPCCDVEFDGHMNLLLGDNDDRCVYVLNAATGEHITTITSHKFNGKIRCLVAQANEELVVGTDAPYTLLTIKYVQ